MFIVVPSEILGMMQPNDMKRPGTRGGTRPKSDRFGGYKPVATGRY